MSDALTFDAAKEGRRSIAVRIVLGAVLLSDVLVFLALVAQARLLATAAAGGTVTDAQLSANDSRTHLLSMARIGAVVICMIAWLVWQHRAYRNMQAVGSRKTNESAGWSVGFWFIPIINLFRPYQIVNELYARSAVCNRGLGDAVPSAPIVGLWWAAYLIDRFVERFASRLADRAQDAEQLLGATRLLLASNVLAALAAVLALLVVTRIHRYQQRCASEAAPAAS